MIQHTVDSRPATRAQRFMLYALSKDKSWYDKELSISEASHQIGILKQEQKYQKLVRAESYQTIWQEALAAGEQAMISCTSTPMVVQQHTNMLDDSSPVEKQWFVSGGVCGFAWVNIKPATAKFSRWLTQHDSNVKPDSYYGGLTYWVYQGGQSMELKSAFAGAMARCLNHYSKQLGIRVIPMERMD